MDTNEQEILDSSLTGADVVKRRRSLLPTWIKVFIWLFMISGLLVPVGLIFAFFGYPFQLSFYGLSTGSPLSPLGIFLVAVTLVKGIAAFGLWTEKDWAINAGTVDAVLGILICVFMMLVFPFVNDQPGFQFNLRLELLLLVPFFLKMRKIKNEWMNSVKG